MEDSLSYTNNNNNNNNNNNTYLVHNSEIIMSLSYELPRSARLYACGLVIRSRARSAREQMTSPIV